jgi:hypothetical protein
LWQFSYRYKCRTLDLLKNQLRNSIAAPYLEVNIRGVYQRYQNLPPIAGINSSGAVQDCDAALGRQSRTRVHQANEAVWHRNANASADQGSGSGGQDQVSGATQISACVPRLGIRWFKSGFGVNKNFHGVRA